MKLAAIDVGSNSIKLVVVDAASGDSFAVLDREKEPVRLGHGTLQEGHLGAEAIGRAAETIRRFRQRAEARGAERVIAVATASVREAENADEFTDEVERATGLRVEVLSGLEEARLIGIAAAQGCAPRGASLLNVDIGGDSTELSLVRGGVPAELYSIKLGAVGLTDAYLLNDPPKQKELRGLREEVRAALERPARELKAARWQHATGTSGTILALGEALRLKAERGHQAGARGAQPPGDEIIFHRLERLNERLAAMSTQERRTGVPGISAQRAEIVVAGGQILEGVMRALKIDNLRSCDFALREGVIIDYLRRLAAESMPPLPDTSDPRLRGVHAVGRRFGYEEAHAHQVARFAEKIFDRLAPSAGLTRQHRTLLSAAALLHDIGYHIAHESHHKHTLYLIKNSELTGFSEAERGVIANVARYHRGAPPKDRHADFAALKPADRETARRLAAILRLADALDRNHDGRVRDIRFKCDGRRARLSLRAREDCEREREAIERRREIFEQVFDCELTVTQTAPAARPS